MVPRTSTLDASPVRTVTVPAPASTEGPQGPLPEESVRIAPPPLPPRLKTPEMLPPVPSNTLILTWVPRSSWFFLLVGGDSGTASRRQERLFNITCRQGIMFSGIHTWLKPNFQWPFSTSVFDRSGPENPAFASQRTTENSILFSTASTRSRRTRIRSPRW